MQVPLSLMHPLTHPNTRIKKLFRRFSQSKIRRKKLESIFSSSRKDFQMIMLKESKVGTWLFRIKILHIFSSEMSLPNFFLAKKETFVWKKLHYKNRNFIVFFSHFLVLNNTVVWILNDITIVSVFFWECII